MRWTRRLAIVGVMAMLVAAMAATTASAQDNGNGGLESFPVDPVIDYIPGVDPNDPEVAAAAEQIREFSAARASSQDAEQFLQVGGVTVTYDPAFPAPADVRVVVEQAVFDWATTLDVGNVPIDIAVSWRNLGNAGILGSAGPTALFNFPPETALVPSPLANVLFGGDLLPVDPEIEVNLNSIFPDWYVGFGNVPSDEWDLYTVMLHELGHGNGFVGSASSAGGTPELRNPPFVYDTHVYHGSDRLLDLPNPNSFLTSNNLFFDLPTGPNYKLYAPTTWAQGSSYSHYDESTYTGNDPGTMMTPRIGPGETQRVIDGPIIGLMEQIGWPIAAPEGLTVLSDPCPTHDSTSGSGSFAGPIGGNATRTVQVTGNLPGAQGAGTGECVPGDATAVVVTLSAIDPLGAGNFRLSASGFGATGGVVNYTSNGLNNANTVTVPLPADGKLDIVANAAASGVRLTVLGYYSASGTLQYTPLTPCAVSDSRTTQGASGDFAGPFTPGNPDPYPDIDVVGAFSAAQGGGNTNCNVPAGADAIVANLIAVNGTGGQGYLSAGSGGSNPSEPMTPFTNIGLNNAAAVVVPLNGETMAVDIESVSGSPSANVRVVVLGYLDTEGNDYNVVNPCTAFDSRSGQGASGQFLGQRVAGAGGVTTYQITGSIPSNQGGGGGDCGVPTGASAVLINLVAIQPTVAGNFRAYATGTTPTGGVLNFAPLTPATNNSNAVVVPLSAGGDMDLYANAPANNGNPTIDARGVILGYYD